MLSVISVYIRLPYIHFSDHSRLIIQISYREESSDKDLSPNYDFKILKYVSLNKFLNIII